MPLATDVPLSIGPSTDAQDNAQVLEVPWYPNDPDESEWCWAACGQMLGSYFESQVIEQCTFATAALSGPDCCNDRGGCNAPIPMGDMSKVFNVIGKTSSLVPSDISFAEMEAEMMAKRPVQVGFKWGDGGGHVALVCGTSLQGDDQQVYVNDPIYGCGWIEWSNLQGAYGLGSWQWTWKQIA
jgi:hypothetical protein